jgi:hypothetical protein
MADALSRRPDYAIGIEPPKTNLLIEHEDGLRYNTNAVLAATITVEEPEFHHRLRTATAKDKMIMTAVQCGEVTQDQGLAVWNGSILVPTTMIQEIIREHHNPPYQGHQGTE